MLPQVAGTLALDLELHRSSYVDLAHQANGGAGDAVVVVSLSLGPAFELVLRELGGRLPLATHSALEPDGRSLIPIPMRSRLLWNTYLVGRAIERLNSMSAIKVS